MKVLFLIRSLNLGGSERQLITLASGLRQRDVKVAIATFYPGGPLEKELEERGIPLFSLGKRTRWDVLGFLWRLVGVVREAKPVVLHGFLGSANILAVLMKPFVSTMRVVWGVRASNMNLAHYGWLDRLLFRIERALTQFSDRIIVNSMAGRDYVEARGFPKDKMVVIPNGIDTERFNPNPSSRDRVRKGWRIGKREFLIGIVGRLDPMKDHETFIRAAGALGRQRQDVRFVCVGSGPAGSREGLETLAEELGLGRRIRWEDATGDVAPVYCALDILTSASVFGEGFSNVIGEAMSCCVPCVVTDVGDSRLIVGETGLVVPPSDPEALSKAWSMALEWTAEERAERSRQARERIINQFNVDRMVEATQKELEQVAGKSLAGAGR